MGTSWEGVLVPAAETQLDALAAAVRSICPLVAPAIRVTLVAGAHPSFGRAWALELTGVNRKPLRLKEPRDLTADLLQPIAAATPGVLPLVERSPEFDVAIMAAGACGEALWAFHSDSLGESASALLRGSQVAESTWSDLAGSQYQGAAFVGAVRRTIPALRDVDQFLDLLYAPDSSRRAWRLMESHQILDTPQLLS